MLSVYPAVFHHEDSSYWVEFPDLEGCQTYGSTLEEAMEEAEEALGLYIASRMDNRQEIRPASDISDIPKPDDGFVSYVSVNADRYRRNTKAVRKTLSIPEWLADEAEEQHLSLSKVLQDGLKSQLGY